MKKVILSLGVCFFFLTSCDKWLTIRPENEIEKTKLYETEEGFWQALNGLYSIMGSNYGPTGHLQCSDVEFLASIWIASSESVEQRLIDHQYKDADADSRLADVFLNQYNMIAHANTILEYLKQQDFLPERSYNIIKGEALGMRAMLHFDLIRLWGPMPNNVDASYRYLPYVQQVSKKVNTYDTYGEYMEKLQADLDSAEFLLGKYEPLLTHTCNELNKNGGDDYDRLEYYWRQNHFNYYAVWGLKARIALWMGDKERALTYAQMVKETLNADGSAKFRLGTANDINITSTDEAVNTLKAECLFGYYLSYYNWQQEFNDNTADFKTPISNIEGLFDDKNDFRYTLCWKVDPDVFTGEPQNVTTYKYKAYNNNWIPQIRLAEMYLIMIECAPLDVANVLYKEFCDSRGMGYKELTEGSRMDILQREYYKEFIGEGQVFYMSKRLGVERMLWGNQKCAEAQYVLPIPRRESEII